MRLTKLEIVQRVLSALDSDNVTSTTETQEAVQVVDLLNTEYERLMAYPWPNLKEVGTLEITDTNHMMSLPDDVMSVDWIRYNSKDVVYISPYEMKVILDSRDTDLDNVDSNGAITDADPVYWTSEDDENIIFDRYDTVLVADTSQCAFVREPAAITDDDNYPDLPARFHSVLLKAILAEAFGNFKGDEVRAAVHRRAYERGLLEMKRWAKRINQNNIVTGAVYGRTNLY